MAGSVVLPGPAGGVHLSTPLRLVLRRPWPPIPPKQTRRRRSSSYLLSHTFQTHGAPAGPDWLVCHIDHTTSLAVMPCRAWPGRQHIPCDPTSGDTSSLSASLWPIITLLLPLLTGGYSYQPGTGFSDSGSGSISTSPSSNGSSALAYPYSAFPPNSVPTYPTHYPLANNYSGFNCGYDAMSSSRRLSSM